MECRTKLVPEPKKFRLQKSMFKNIFWAISVMNGVWSTKNFSLKQNSEHLIVRAGVGKVIEMDVDIKVVGSLCASVPVLILRWYRNAFWRLAAWWSSATHLFDETSLQPTFTIPPSILNDPQMYKNSGRRRLQEEGNCRIKFSSLEASDDSFMQFLGVYSVLLSRVISLKENKTIFV
jgi:hypothetical protein